MGGHALEKYGITTERKSKVDFDRISNEILTLMKSIDCNCQIIKSYHDKESHGDLDVLVTNYGNDFNNEIKALFNAKVMYVNSNVISLAYDNFQIDFIKLSNKLNLETAKNYFNYDPIGNIMGKVAHKLNMSYGYDGLFYYYRNNFLLGKREVNVQSKILITDKSDEIFDVLGFDYERYLDGFDKLTDIFDFVIHSKYFDTESFQFENLNRIDRKRNIKRKSYNEFLKYIVDNNIHKVFKKQSTESIIEMIDNKFQNINIHEEISKLETVVETEKIVYSKFNVSIIKEKLPDLTDVDLRILIRNFKLMFVNFNKYVIENTSDNILEEIINYYNTSTDKK